MAVLGSFNPRACPKARATLASERKLHSDAVFQSTRVPEGTRDAPTKYPRQNAALSVAEREPIAAATLYALPERWLFGETLEFSKTCNQTRGGRGHRVHSRFARRS